MLHKHKGSTRKLLAIAAFLLMRQFAIAQDVHFSQFHNVPLALNPALTGLMNHDLRAMGSYRTQWGSVTVPFNTFTASADAAAFRGFAPNDYVGLGLLLVNDQAGDSKFRTTQAQLSIAYHKALGGGGNHYLTVGFQYGGVQQAIDFDALYFDNQFNGSTFDPTKPTGEHFGRDRLFYQDVSAGISWFHAPADEFNYYLGAAAAHLNQPGVGFFTQNIQETLYSKFTLHGGGSFPFQEWFTLQPRVIFQVQGPHKEVNLGLLAKWYLNDDNAVGGQTNFYAGGLYRLGDALVPIVKMDYGPFTAGASYDINLSKLLRASSSVGGLEFSFSYTYDLPSPHIDRSRPVKCPAFD
jgi:type IX secretion system PorP/SprF family membrane protein